MFARSKSIATFSVCIGPKMSCGLSTAIITNGVTLILNGACDIMDSLQCFTVGIMMNFLLSLLPSACRITSVFLIGGKKSKSRPSCRFRRLEYFPITVTACFIVLRGKPTQFGVLNVRNGW